jgi:hypothetical protein
MSNAGFGTSREGASNDMGVFGDHPREGAWRSEKGSNQSAWLQTVGMEGTDNEGPDRLNQEVSTTGSWDSHVIVQTGMTHGGGTMAH